MSTELVERLRGGAAALREDRPYTADAMEKAADELTALTAKVAMLTEALAKIAAFDDEAASQHLIHTESYGAFDEPSSVETARRALSEPDKEPK